MSIEIKTNTVEPIRQTYSNIARRFGNKPASRYQEASYDVEAQTNFHYRPLWDPARKLNDPTRTAMRMADWHAVSDPRQFYYGAYVQNRAKMQEATEHSYSFCDKRGFITRLPESVQESLLRLLVPLRHVDLAANMNNSAAAGDSIAATVAQMHIYQAMDRLGIGQYLSRIALMIDGNTGTALDRSKSYWMTDALWQPMRRLAEDTLVVRDWFELSLVQNLIIDGHLFPLMYHHFDQWLAGQGAEDVSMLTEFMRDWYKESTRWVDAMVKTVAAEDPENARQIQAWLSAWQPRVIEALQPLAEASVGAAALDDVSQQFTTRVSKLGLAIQGAAA